MATRRILPNVEPALHKKCRVVTRFDDRLHTLLDDMRETLLEADGVGLAAPQVGILRRAIVVLETNVPEGEEPKMIELVNPEIIESSGEQFGPEGWTLYKGLHLMTFVDNHDVSRVSSILSNEKHLPLIYALAFGMPGIPCVYYGSEWGAKGNKSDGDPALRACFEEPLENELTEFIGKLSDAKKASKALNYGSFRSVVLTNRQCIFERAAEGERVLVAINADSEPYTAHFDAGCGMAVDLISGEAHDFGGGSQLAPYSAYFWRCEA